MCETQPHVGHKTQEVQEIRKAHTLATSFNSKVSLLSF